MANTTIYPYGTGGQLPSSIGVINDRTTGGADKAWSAEQGKLLCQDVDDMGKDVEAAIDCVGYTSVVPTGLTVDTGKRLSGTLDIAPATDSNYNVLKTLTLYKGETVYFKTSGMASSYAVIAEFYDPKYHCLVAGDGGTNTVYSYTATRTIRLGFCYKASNTYSIWVESSVVNPTSFNEVKASAETSAVSSVYIDADATYALSAEQTKSNTIWSETFDGTLKKGGRYVIHLSGTAALTYGGNYISLVLNGINSGKTRTVFYISKANNDTFTEQDVVICPLEDSTLSIASRFGGKLTIKGSGIYSKTITQLLPDRFSTIFDPATLWLKYTTQTIRGYHDLSWHKDNLWAFNKYTDGNSFVYNSSNVEIKRFLLKFDETFKDSTTSPLQFKSADWHEQKNLLLVGNGKQGYSSSDSYCYIFYEAEDWLESTEDITFENCGEYAKLDFTTLGVKCYGYWAYDNNADTMFVSVNLFKDIYLVQLGKGTNDFSQLTGGGGVYASGTASGKYNGSWVVLNHWTQSEYVGTNSDHGGQFYGGYLYLGDNNGNFARVFRITFNDDGTMKWQKMRFGYRKADSSGIIEGSVDGMCIRDGKMWVNILNVSGQTNRNITAVADII